MSTLRAGKEAWMRVSNALLSNLDLEYFKKLAQENRLLNPFYRIAAQSFIDWDFPKHLLIETTSVCNLRCQFCSREEHLKEQGHMDFSLFRKIIDEAAEYGPRSFSLHLFGEPLLHPRIVDMVAYIKERRKENSVLLTTNGVKMDAALYQALAEAGLDRVHISLLAADADAYQRITGSKRFDTLVANVLSAAEVHARLKLKKPAVFLRYLHGNDSDQELEQFRTFWEKTGFNLEIRPLHNIGGRFEGSKIDSSVFANRWPCYHLWFAPGIGYNGDLTVCCNDPGHELATGNVVETSISSLWKGEAMESIRKAHMSGNFACNDLCRDCDVWALYPDVFFEFQKRKAR